MHDYVQKEQYVKFSTIFNKYLCLSLSEDTTRFFEEREELNEDQAEMRIAPNVRFKGITMMMMEMSASKVKLSSLKSHNRSNQLYIIQPAMKSYKMLELTPFDNSDANQLGDREFKVRKIQDHQLSYRSPSPL